MNRRRNKCGRIGRPVDITNMVASDDKRLLRAEMKRRLLAIDPADRAARSRQASSWLCNEPAFVDAATVMAFWSFSDEIDTRPICVAALAMGKRLCLPRMDDARRAMVPVVMKDVDAPMATDHHGVCTPLDTETVDIAAIDLVVTPGLAFDRAGWRLGRGGGYYDRFFADPACRAVRCGLAMDLQVVDHVPTDPDDQPLDMLVTDQHVRHFDRHAVRPDEPEGPADV